MAKKRQAAALTERHYVDLAQASSAQTTLTAYGKLIKNSEASPSSVGLSHPRGLSEALQASLVVGVAIGGRCITLHTPRQVMLPAPDGPADGCSWDPAEYVVWKNLPRDWITVHFLAIARSVSEALLFGSGDTSLGRMLTTPVSAVTGVRDRVVAMVRAWAQMPGNPRGTDQLMVLWATYRGLPPADGAQLLAQQVNDAFNTKFMPGDFNPPDKIKTVDDLVDAIT
jgi:hypothetical protein